MKGVGVVEKMNEVVMFGLQKVEQDERWGFVEKGKKKWSLGFREHK